MDFEIFSSYLGYRYCYRIDQRRTHYVFKNIQNGQISSVPRLSDLDKYSIYFACKELGVPMPEQYSEFEAAMNKIK